MKDTSIVNKLSIVTINYNNLNGLKKTIESVTTQISSDFHFVIVDGGSSDGSFELIKENEHVITRWISEKDNGIYDAMNKGIQLAQDSEYLLFLNSGDYLSSKTVIAEIADDLTKYDLIGGNIAFVNKSKKCTVIKNLRTDQIDFVNVFNHGLHHQSTFISSSLFKKVGLYNEQIKISADWQFFMSALFVYHAKYKYINKTIAIYNYEGLSSLESSKKIVKSEKSTYLNLILSQHYDKVDMFTMLSELYKLKLKNELKPHQHLKHYIKKALKR